MNLKELKHLNESMLSPYVSIGLNSAIDMIISYQEEGVYLWRFQAFKTPDGFTLSAFYIKNGEDNGQIDTPSES